MAKNSLAKLRIPRKTKAGLAKEAYEILGIHEADVMGVPKIQPLLEQAGVLSKVWEYLAASDDEVARLLLAKLRCLSKSHVNALPFEAFCVAAKVETKKVFGVICSEVYAQTEQTSLLMAASAHPDVVKATIEAAVHPTGSKERAMLLSHSGFVPVPKTSVVNIHGGKNVLGGTQQIAETAALPPIESFIRNVSDRFNEGHALPAPEVVDVEEGDDDSEE
jgi:hypothetical protein